MKQNITIRELADVILREMGNALFSAGTIKGYANIFKRLEMLAKKRKDLYYTSELGRSFIEDSSYVKSEGYCRTRYCLHNRCIQFIESYLEDGQVDWLPQRVLPKHSLKSKELSDTQISFGDLMVSSGLKANTIDGYGRFVHYFLMYLENKGYRSVTELKGGDIITFVALVCKEHYQPTSLGAHLPGLRMFLKMYESTAKFEAELPEHLPKKRDIIGVYSDEEHDQILKRLESGNISFRNKAICLIALETGLRAVDICNLKLGDIDWGHDSIHIVQEKTGKPMNIPLRASIGNALTDYLLSERPASDSEYIFLSSYAPHTPMKAHSGYRKVLLDVISDAGIEANGRISGTRITRHSTASRMLRHGVPLPVISEALGHGNPNSVMVYLSTEDAKLAECTLPLPEVCHE
ncbi:MAG: tyrosine-type recombinase/integrase [Desulfitobacteriia bacterium]|jgi:site-specific recombinase XerD